MQMAANKGVRTNARQAQQHQTEDNQIKDIEDSVDDFRKFFQKGGHGSLLVRYREVVSNLANGVD